MEQAVIISIKGRQEVEGAPAENMELVTQGWLRREEERYLISYPESEVTGLEGTMTTIQVEPEQDRVVLIREGDFSSRMIFEEGQRNLTMYRTPYGALTLGVNTRHLLAELDDQGGSVEIEYLLEMEGAAVGRNLFQIQVRRDTRGGSLKH